MNTKWNELSNTIARTNFLTPGKNPVVIALNTGVMSKERGIEVIIQYYYLVTYITQFLVIAMVRIPVASAKKELHRNLGEELGSQTNGVSNQEMLEQFLVKELDVNVRVPWSEGTETFITGLLKDFSTRTPGFVAGMIYALEATACPELKVVAEIINAAAGREIVNLAILEDQSHAAEIRKHGVNTLADFLALHTLDFEVGHENGLRITLESFASENWPEFQNGFNCVIVYMMTWWLELSF